MHRLEGMFWHDTHHTAQSVAVRTECGSACGSQDLQTPFFCVSSLLRKTTVPYNGACSTLFFMGIQAAGVKRCEQPDRPVATRVRGRGRTGRLGGLLASLTPGSAHCAGRRETAWLGVGLRAD